MFDELGTSEKTDDTQNEKLLRLLIVTSACRLRYSKCTHWARSLYDQWVKMENPYLTNMLVSFLFSQVLKKLNFYFFQNQF